ncbi:hypothetical protein F5Y13DRAFT_23056 [Hypoxylon sp. FL1857]|nr:hypothetical protein F5Y13DRAFT_23056 [Hypoxylon sp. FL1857]
MEQLQNTGVDQSVDEAQPPQLEIILQSIDELMNSAILQHATSSDDTSLRSRHLALEKFKEMMVTVQRKAAKATHEVETKLGLISQRGMSLIVDDASLEDLVGVSLASNLNRLLGRMLSAGKQSYKLRDFSTGATSPQLVIDGDAAASFPMNPENATVVLQPTLRNVWVIQHAYAKLLNHKEHLIKQYLEEADPSVLLSRKFSREYYEELGLANLPSKNKLGNLLDVKSSSHHHANHDMMIVLVFMDFNGNHQYVEAVTGDSVDMSPNSQNNSYLILPVTEASVKKLYDAYRSLRKATSEQRRAAKDKEFAANLPVDAMDELQNFFKFGGSGEPSQTSGNKKRRMLDDNE